MKFWGSIKIQFLTRIFSAFALLQGVNDNNYKNNNNNDEVGGRG
jgi:hypothetical protein